MYWQIFFVVLNICISKANDDDIFDMKKSACERITVKECRSMQWNVTKMPNLLNHQTQDVVEKNFHVFSNLFYSSCSPYISYLICSFLTPFCCDGEIVPPCRKFCEHVKFSCRSMDWPSQLDCSSLSDEPCLHKDDLDKDGALSLPVSARFVCPSSLKTPQNWHYILRFDKYTVPDCGMPCNFGIFRGDGSPRFFLTLWSGVCLFSCLFTILTYSIDKSRFRYPEKSIVYMSVCFVFISVAYLIGTLNPNIGCKKAKQEALLVQGLISPSCTTLFILTYFSWMAAALWFVILSFTWFLAAALKWSHEATQAYSVYFHLIAWSLPAIKTIAILCLKLISADPLSGICFPGINDVGSLRGFVIAPHVLYLLFGSIFLFAGFVSLFKTRNVMKGEGTKTDKLEKLMFRIGFFTLLYLIPSLAFVACNYYEQNARLRWMNWWYLQVCRVPSMLVDCPTDVSVEQPFFEIFLLKHVMFLFVGTIASFWIWSSKTFRSWRTFFYNLCHHKNVEAAV